jgi:hypothetical protein
LKITFREMIHFTRLKMSMRTPSIHWLLCLTLTATLGATAGAAPTPVDNTAGTLSTGLLPGPFPTTVSAANIDVAQFTPGELNGANQNNLMVTLPQSGPIKWTGSRFNEGDLSFSISPGDPNNPAYFPDSTFKNDYKPLDGQPFAETTIAWRLNAAAGLSLASVRHNGVNYGSQYTFGGAPVGLIRGVAYFNGSGSGYGFRMSDGEFSNGGGGSNDLQMGTAGDDGGTGEATFDVAAAHFPYEQGWLGAWVNGGVDGEATYTSIAPTLPTSIVNFNSLNSTATVSLPGVNSATDGMLFVAPTHDNNSTNIAAGFPTGGGWTVGVREDNDANVSGDSSTLLLGNDGAFQMLYVPYTAGGLIGGHINGTTGAAINSAGDARFDLTRTAAGQYAVSVYQPNGVTKLTGNDGMLILSVADSMSTDPTLPDRTFLSYEYDAGSGNFIVQSRELSSTTGGTENQFGNVLSLRDSDFYFAWVDFTNPLTPNAAANPADFNNSGTVDSIDLGIWKESFDVDADGDADGDNDTDGNDFLIWQRNVTGAGAAAVPEPASLALLIFGVAALAAAGRRIG